MSQEVAVDVPPEAGQDEEEETVGVLNVAVPLTLSMRNSSVSWAPDSHVTEATPHSLAFQPVILDQLTLETLPTSERPRQPDEPDQLVLEESPSREGEAGPGEGAREGGGDSVAPVTLAPTPPQTDTVIAPLFQVLTALGT